MDRTTRTNRRHPLSLFRIAKRIIAPIFPGNVLSTRFVRRLFLTLLVANDALLRRASVLRLRHACLAAMLAAHVPFAFQIVCSCHFENSGWPQILELAIVGNVQGRR
jgi:hypothetical protein